MKVRTLGAIVVLIAVIQLYAGSHPITATILLLLFLDIL